MFRFIVILLCFCTLIRSLPSLSGCSMMGLTVDPVSLQKGINILDPSGICITSDNKFTYPCNLLVELINVTTPQLNSTVYTSTTNYTYDGSTRVSFFPDFDPSTVNARFANESLTFVHTMMSENVTMVMTEAELQLYQISILNNTLSPEFTNYVTTLVARYEAGDIEGYNYWLNQFIQNTPIAFINRVIVGGRLQQTQYVNDSYYQTTDPNIITGCASATGVFEEMFSVTGNWGVTSEEIQTFRESMSQVSVMMIGSSYIPGITLEQWESSVEQTPGILEYYLSSTSNYITPEFFPSHNIDTIQFIRSTYETSWLSYLMNNSKLGCTDKFAINFQLDAVVDDGSCVFEYVTTSSYGGIYMTEIQTIDGIASTKYYHNPITGQSSCPTNSNATCTTYENKGKWQGYSYQIDLTICTCMGLGSSFGGIYAPGIKNSFYTIKRTTNAITNGMSCPNGTTNHNVNGMAMCTGDDIPSWVYGGVYYYVGNVCTPNIITNECSCPPGSYDITSIGITVQVPLSPLVTGSINFCVTRPMLKTNPNPGVYPIYVAIDVDNVTWVTPSPAPTTTTPSPTTITPSPSPSSPAPIPSPTPNSSPSPSFTFVYWSVGSGIVIATILSLSLLIYLRRSQRVEYVPI